jgi:hypothetical protein
MTQTLPTTVLNPLSAAQSKSSLQLKQNKIRWSRSTVHADMHKREMTKQEKNLRTYHTTSECLQLNVCFHFAYIIFYFTDN